MKKRNIEKPELISDELKSACNWAEACPLYAHEELSCEECKANNTDVMSVIEADKWWEKRIKELNKEASDEA